jgi:hypothetical protein
VNCRFAREINSPQLGYGTTSVTLDQENLAFRPCQWLRQSVRAPLDVTCQIASGLRDHEPPFAGDVDLRNLFRSPLELLFVWEMSPRKTR